MKPVNLNAVNLPHQSARPTDSVRSAERDSNQPTPVADSDSIHVTNSPDQVATLVERAKDLPDVRHERVQEIRQAVQSGKYRVSADDIAEAILRDEN